VPLVKSKDPVEQHNAEEISKLLRWQRRTGIIFYGSIVEMVLGLFVPCVATGIINLQKIGLDYAQMSMLAAVILPLFGLGGVLLMAFDFRRSRRCLQLARQADALGLSYTYQPSREEIALFSSLKFVNMLRVTHAVADKNLLQGMFKKRSIIGVDFSFSHNYGNRLYNVQQTIVVFRESFQLLPDFVVVSLWMGEKFEQFIGGSPIGKKFKIPEEDEFNRLFSVAGERRSAILGCLTPKLIDLCLQDDRLTFLIQDGMLLVARRDTVLAANEYEDFLSTASLLARELEPAAASEPEG
jgi:hypothetical protein